MRNTSALKVDTSSENESIKQRLEVAFTVHASWLQALTRQTIIRYSLDWNSYEDFLATAYESFVSAYHAFHSKDIFHFRNYCRLRVRGAIIDRARSNSELSAKGCRFRQQLGGLAITDGDYALEGAESLSEERARLGRILRHLKSGALAFRKSFGEASTELAALTDSVDPEKIYDKRESLLLLMKLVRRLPELERCVIEQYYFEDKNLHEIECAGEKLTKGWASKLHRRALKRMQEDPVVMEQREE